MVSPQLVTLDTSGIHNADVDATRTRLMRGGSWKRQRTIVIIPSDEMIAAKVYLSHCALAFPPNNGVIRILALGQEVGEAYSNAITSILADPNLREWEYIMTLEHDNLVPPDAALRLIERLEEHPEFACVGAAYHTKGPGGVLQAWGDVSDPTVNFRPQLPDQNGGLVECCGTGMGANVFRMSMFRDERLRRPWFQTQKKNGVSTQDLFFWSDARKYGYRCAIDCSVKSGHYDRDGSFGIQDFSW